MRLDLSALQPGAYAVLRDRATWGLMKKVQANLNAESDTVKDPVQFADDMLQGLVTEWSVKDDDGMLVPLPKLATPDQIDNIAAEIIGHVLQAARKVLSSGAPDPKTDTP